MAERVWPLEFKEGEPPALVRALYAATQYAETLTDENLPTWNGPASFFSEETPAPAQRELL